MTDKKENTVSLHMIVRDHEEELERCLGSIAQHVDELVVAVDTRTKDMDSIVAIIEKHGGKAYPFEWKTKSFSAARTYALSKCTGDIAFWLDADDVVVNGDVLIDWAKRRLPETCGLLFIPYNYSQDEVGQCSCYLERERFFWNNDEFMWTGVVHEVVAHKSLRSENPDECRARTMWPEDLSLFEIIHDDNQATSPSRHNRVRDALLEQEASGDPLDSREQYYLGLAECTHGDLDAAVECFRKGIEISKGERDIFAYLNRLMWGDRLFESGNYAGAARIYNWLIEFWPDEQLSWFRLAEALRLSGRGALAIDYVVTGRQKMRMVDYMAINPRSYDADPCRTIGFALIEHELYERAEEELAMAVEYDPASIKTREMLSKVKETNYRNKIMTAFMTIKDTLAKEAGSSDTRKIDFLKSAAPLCILPHEMFGDMTYPRGSESPEKQIVFVNTQELAVIGPESRIHGCGGSEEALLVIPQAIARLGYDVTVYTHLSRNTPFALGGVRYLPLAHIQKDKPYGVVVGWRTKEAAMLIPRAEYRFLWMTDVMPPEETGFPGRSIALTKDHAESASPVTKPGIMKVIHLPIIPEEFTPSKRLRNPYKCVWGSRFERGVLSLMKVWPRIVEHHPEATLFVSYPTDALHELRMREDKAYGEDYNEMHRTIASWPTEVRRTLTRCEAVIGQGAQQDLFSTAGVWLYPTDFIETCCLTALKAQAGGMYPVANTIGALKETVHPSYQFDLSDEDAFVEKACYYIGRDEHEERAELSDFAGTFSDTETARLFSEEVEAWAAERRSGIPLGVTA